MFETIFYKSIDIFWKMWYNYRKYRKKGGVCRCSIDNSKVTVKDFGYNCQKNE